MIYTYRDFVKCYLKLKIIFNGQTLPKKIQEAVNIIIREIKPAQAQNKPWTKISYSRSRETRVALKIVKKTDSYLPLSFRPLPGAAYPAMRELVAEIGKQNIRLLLQADSFSKSEVN